MTDLHDAWLAKHHARWLRPNARLYMRANAHRFLRPDPQRFLRPDWKRYVQPGFDPLFVHALLEGKANFDPNQPRVPKGNPDGGQWTDEGGDGEDGLSESDDDASTDISDARRQSPGIGHNEGPPLEPPEVPQQRPPTTPEKNAFLKVAAYWLAKAYRVGTPVGAFLSAMQAASWLDTDRAFIDAYQDPPKAMKELQEAASESKLGYHIHHIAEKASAREDGISEALINGADNLVRIPALKHWQITGWSMTPHERFGGLSPRQYLRGKDWEERQKVGREALIEFGILKP
jgi:hypothetical protein